MSLLIVSCPHGDRCCEACAKQPIAKVVAVRATWHYALTGEDALRVFDAAGSGWVRDALASKCDVGSDIPGGGAA